MSFIFYFSIVMVVTSNILYHIFQKTTPASANPMLALAVTYLVSTLSCLLMLPFFPLKETLSASLKHINLTSVGLGIAIVFLELGFLLAYRAGWNISLAGFVANTTVALILLPVGLAFFKEKLSPINLLGVVIAVIGLIMINKK